MSNMRLGGENRPVKDSSLNNVKEDMNLRCITVFS